MQTMGFLQGTWTRRGTRPGTNHMKPMFADRVGTSIIEDAWRLAVEGMPIAKTVLRASIRPITTALLLASILVSPGSSPRRQTEPTATSASDRDEVATIYSRSEIRCLARAIWHEARGEPLAGQIAVAEVIIARSKDRRWRGDLCRTIRMPHQFSFVRNGRTLPIRDAKGAQRMMDLARAVATNTMSSPARGSLFYHATSVKPIWRHGLERTVRIENHVFYRDTRQTAARLARSEPPLASNGPKRT